MMYHRITPTIRYLLVWAAVWLMVPTDLMAQEPHNQTLLIHSLDIQTESSPEVMMTAQISVADGQGKPIVGLTQPQFAITHNGQPIEAPVVVQPVNGPLALTIIIDHRAAMIQPGPDGLRPMERARDVAEQLILQQLQPGDQLSISLLNQVITEIQPWHIINESSRIQAINALRTGLTYDEIVGDSCGLYQAMNQATIQSPSNSLGRRAILVFTNQPAPADNGCASGQVSLQPQPPIPFFVVQVGPTAEATLKQNAEASGGRFLPYEALADLSTFYSILETQLRPQYQLSYPAPLIAGQHVVAITANTAQGAAQNLESISLDPSLVPATPVADSPVAVVEADSTLQLKIEDWVQTKAGLLQIAFSASPLDQVEQISVGINGVPAPIQSQNLNQYPLTLIVADPNLAPGDYSMVVQAQDKSGQVARDSRTITLTTPLPTEAEGGSSLPLLLAVGFGLAVAGFIGFRRWQKVRQESAWDYGDIQQGPNPDVTVLVSQPDPESAVKLIVIDGPAELSQLSPLKITSVKTTLGRSADGVNGDDFLALPDQTVSRKHAEIIREPASNTFFIRDISTSNPILVDGLEIPKASNYPLQPGNQIQLGRVTLRFEQGELIAPAVNQINTADYDPNKTVLVSA